MKRQKSIPIGIWQALKSTTKTLKPKKITTGSEWAERNFYLTTNDAAEPGRFTFDRCPWQKEILDALSDNIHEFVALKCSAQVGKTTLLTIDILRAADEQPGGFAVLFPALHSATSYSQDRFDPAIEVSPGAKGVFHEHKYGRSENTKYVKKFTGGQVRFITANSSSAMKSKPIARLYCEEVNEYPFDVSGQGAPLDIALKRTIAFEGVRKVFLNSTPTTEKYGLIESWQGT